MFVDILYCSFLFALLGGLWYLNQPREKQLQVAKPLKYGINLLGGVLALGAVFFWLKTINEAPFQPIIKPGTHRLAISAEQWGKTWPLRVPSGTLECLPGAEVVFHTQGKTFAVNGQAKLKSLPKLEILASPDQYIPKARKDLSAFQRMGLRLCN
ncbi:MAG: DUF2511 domain-containing protein [Candidatus Sericytochromatia bacterium]|nr:DUF2511 domain-containing protein [Candidatus Sericytochromatia bacterium]